jgi:hypothetical protein
MDAQAAWYRRLEYYNPDKGEMMVGNIVSLVIIITISPCSLAVGMTI